MINKLNILRFFLGIIFVILPSGLVIAEDSGVSVFMYHRVGDHRYPSTNVSIEQLKSQIFEVKKNHYNILKASDVVRHIAEGIEFKKNSNSWCLILVALPQGNRKKANNTSHKRAFDLFIVPPDYFVERDICRSYTRFTEPPRRE